VPLNPLYLTFLVGGVDPSDFKSTFGSSILLLLMLRLIDLAVIYCLWSWLYEKAARTLAFVTSPSVSNKSTYIFPSVVTLIIRVFYIENKHKKHSSQVSSSFSVLT